jgi:hypothetical protein
MRQDTYSPVLGAGATMVNRGDRLDLPSETFETVLLCFESFRNNQMAGQSGSI